MINYQILEEFNEKFFSEMKLNNNDLIFNLFQLVDWIKILTEFSNNLVKLKIVVIYRDEKIIFIAPLCIKNIGGCRQLSWLSSEIIDYNNAIFSNDYLSVKKQFYEICNKIIKEISTQCDLVYFDKIPEFIMGELNPTLSKNYTFYQYSYQLNLENLDFDEFYNSKNNNKTIQTDRRKKKKLKEGEELLFTYEDCNAQNFLDVEKLIVEKINYYKSKKLKTFENYIITKYKKLIINNNDEYKFQICHCLKGNEKISSILGVVQKNIFYYLIPVVYKTKYIKFSPGKFHIINLIEWSINKKLRLIDFSPGDENYKLNWSNQKFKIFYHLKLLNMRGLLRFFILKIYYFLRKNRFVKKLYNLIKIYSS